MPAIMPISELRRQLSQMVDQLQQTQEAIFITQHGRPAAVLVNYEQYEALVARAEGKAGQRHATPYGESSLLSRLADMAGDVGPEDLAEQHDHYLYGSEKK